MDAYTVLSTLVLLLSGWLIGAESASWALVQPVVARLDDTPQIRMQQGMLRTFGRVMPILLPLTSVLIVLTALLAPPGTLRVLWRMLPTLESKGQNFNGKRKVGYFSGQSHAEACPLKHDGYAREVGMRATLHQVHVW